MLAQLKIIVLFKEAIQLTFFGLLEYLEHQVWLRSQNDHKERAFFRNSSVYSCFEKWKRFHVRNCWEFEDILQRCVLIPSQSSTKLALVLTVLKDKYIRVSSLKNRCLTSPQQAASLNSTWKTPVSPSTVKSPGLWDAGLQGSVSKQKPYLWLTNKRKGLKWAKEHGHWTKNDWRKRVMDRRI